MHIKPFKIRVFLPFEGYFQGPLAHSPVKMAKYSKNPAKTMLKQLKKGRKPAKIQYEIEVFGMILPMPDIAKKRGLRILKTRF